MKKLLALMLAAALALSLVACGGDSGAGDNNTPSGGNGDTTSTDTPSGGGEDDETEKPTMTKEEMLGIATELDAIELDSTLIDNMAKANSTYVGNTYTFSLVVQRVESDYCVLAWGNGGQFSIHAYLPEEDLVCLNSGESVTIVGTISSLVNPNEPPYYIRYAEVEPAYFVTNVSEHQGVILDFISVNGKKYCKIGCTGVHLDDDIMSTLQEGDFISVSGVMTYEEKHGDLPTWWIDNATLVE